MTEEKLKLAVNDMLSILKVDKHCIDSYRAVASVKTLKDYAIVLNQFRTELRHQNFPTAEYMRKWFIDDLEEINQYGVYIDQKDIVHSQNEFDVFIFGESEVTFVGNCHKHQHIVVNNNSKVNVIPYPYSVCFVQLKNNSDCKIVDKPNSSIIKVIDKRNNE